MHLMELELINKIKYFITINRLENNAHGWFHSMLALYAEIAPSLSNPELRAKLDKEIKELLPIINQITMMHNKTNKNYLTNELYERLHNLQIFLGDCMKEAGLLIKLKEDSGAVLK